MDELKIALELIQALRPLFHMKESIQLAFFIKAQLHDAVLHP